MSLYLKDIRKSYGDNHVLEGVTLSISEGEIVGLVGRNGVGKTTLLKIIAGVLSQDEGVVTTSGKISYLSERNPLYAHMIVKEYLMWLRSIHGNELPLSDLDEIIGKVGIEKVTGVQISRLSKGYKQRVGLASVLIPTPRILILDEPINGLDPIQIKEYRSLIREIREDKVIILSSHLMQEIEAICDRVILLADGKIVTDRYIEKKDQAVGSSILIQLDRSCDLREMERLEEVDQVFIDGSHCYRITPTSNQDIRPLIFDYVVSQGARILEMREVDTSLNDLFKTLS